jgi:hypothetical protein
VKAKEFLGAWKGEEGTEKDRETRRPDEDGGEAHLM